MIKCNKGVVAISGEAGTILTELAGIIEAIHEKTDRSVWREGSRWNDCNGGASCIHGR